MDRITRSEGTDLFEYMSFLSCVRAKISLWVGKLAMIGMTRLCIL